MEYKSTIMLVKQWIHHPQNHHLYGWDSNHQFIWVVYDTALGTLPKLAGACRLYICLCNAYAYFM